MRHIENFGDERQQLANCIYCGSLTETKDHVPSKVLLDKPYPDHLPTVPACSKCNQSFSLDEEYLACLIECTFAGSTEVDKLRRGKVQRIIKKKPPLAARLSHARKESGEEGVYFNIEHDRVHNVILKLARGHLAYEYNTPEQEEPHIIIKPLTVMDENERCQFEVPPLQSLWPEVGSRGMQRLAMGDPQWIVVQPTRYRYLMELSESKVIVRIVISEYLACEVTWTEA